MTHAERLRAMANDKDELTGVSPDIPALLAGAAAIEALTPRRITEDPATWPGEGERVIVGTGRQYSLPQFATREACYFVNDDWHCDVPVKDFAWWVPFPLPMPPGV